MAKSEFDKAKERLRRDARTLAEQARVLQAFTDGHMLTRDELDAEFADWQPPTDEQVEQRAAQELVAAAIHSEDLEVLAAEAQAGLRKGVDKAQATLDGVKQALQEADEELARQSEETQRWRAEVDKLPEHLRGIQPAGQVVRVHAQTAEASASAHGANGGGA